MSDPVQTNPGRSNQKRRTREALIDAAALLTRGGHIPTIPEVAEAALVSTATAYRYFPSIGDLLLQLARREVDARRDDLAAKLPRDSEQRASALVGAVSASQLENEALWRGVLSASLERWLAASDTDRGAHVAAPGPLWLPTVRAALAPLAEDLGPERYRRLVMATMLVCGVEAMVAARDACGLEPGEAGETIQWAARALIRAAILEQPSGAGPPPP